jgi:hypothetical protein
MTSDSNRSNDNPSIDHEVEDAILGDELFTGFLIIFQKHLNINIDICYEHKCRDS